ncbi:hypothetical protein [Helicobacter pylori]|nr:hypothetical protein [Helicobacter pylori]
MNGEFWRKSFIFNTNAFFADTITKPTQALACLQSVAFIRVGQCLTK